MNTLLGVVLPVFSLVGAGWIARRLAFIGPAGAHELNRFVLYLGMPALLFQIMAKASWHDLYQPGFVAVFGLGCGAIYAATLLARRMTGQSLADASLDGLNAGYANVGFIGFPLCLAAYGPSALPTVTIAAILTVCILFGVAVMAVEIGENQGGTAMTAFYKVSRSLAKNPMLLAPALGVLYAALAPPLPQGLDRFLTLLGGAASPCALVSLGLFIAEPRPRPNWRPLSAMVALKLLAQPLVTWLLAHYVFNLSPSLTGVAVVLAALPTGTGPYMLAAMYKRDPSLVAGSVLISTVTSIFSVAMLVSFFKS